MCVQWEILLGGASFVSLAGQHTYCWQNCDNQAATCKHKCLYLSYRAHIPGGGGGGTPYDDQCTMLGGLDPHFRAWLDSIGSIFELGSIP